MARTVWKYVIDPKPENVAPGVPLDMPVGAKPLAVHEQHGKIALWWEVDSEQPYERRTFDMYGTGHPIEYPGDYIGTASFQSGWLMIHIYERQET